jgi:hypothetical protein
MNNEETLKPPQSGGSALNDGLGGCQWTQEDDWDNSSIYSTDCGDAFSITEETPFSNGMKFCCYCGKPLIQVLFESKDEDV